MLTPVIQITSIKNINVKKKGTAIMHLLQDAFPTPASLLSMRTSGNLQGVRRSWELEADQYNCLAFCFQNNTGKLHKLISEPKYRD